MKVSLIVAMDEQKGIGLNGKLPWNLPEDLQLFKQRTMGHIVLVGRITWEQIPATLKGRTVLVLTNQKEYVCPKGVATTVHSLSEALRIVAHRNEPELFVIGGTGVYKSALRYVSKMYITAIPGIYHCDTYFPDIDWSQWKILKTEAHGRGNSSFIITEYIKA